MRNLIYNILILLIGFSSFGFINDTKILDKDSKIKIQWIDNLNGDFDFNTIWSYPEGIYKNQFGQLSCDGFCPEGTESMKDSEGKIYTDSLTKFYQLVDTTHQFHSISCEAWCYEWAGTDYITAKQTNKNQTICSTHLNSGTHCKLILEINNDTCIPRIELNTITSPELKTYYCQGGFIKVDSELWTNGILKAEFDFDFNNTDEPDRKMYWKGNIYTMIEK
jgi:hypothetical protein